MENCIIYQPAEDTFLIQKHIKYYAKGNVLEIGTGLGVLAVEAAQCPAVQSVLAVDIQKGVINHCKKKINNPKITFKQSDLFSHVSKNKRFDNIIFNPPYLPANPRDHDVTIDAGKNGYEIIVRYLDEVNLYLSHDGKILLLFSSLSRKHIIDAAIKNNLLEAKEIDHKHISFETLYVYAIKKSQLLKELEKNSITNIHYFAKGKRSLVYKGKYKNKTVIIKIPHPNVEATSTVQFETYWLKKLNTHNIGPKLLFSAEQFLVMELIDGILFEQHIRTRSKQNIIKVIKELFDDMYLLDRLEINKQEMNHPQKHIIIKNNKPILIDFERCRYTENPKNVTQFVQFLTSINIAELLEKKGFNVVRENMQNAAKKYKKERSKEKYNKIIALIK